MRLSTIQIRILLYLIFSLCGVDSGFAETFPKIRFTPLPSDMLPSSEVRKLYQDSDGYIWIPTYNGLSRYDGYGVVSYGVKDVTGANFCPFVNVVAEDRDKNLWIGTEQGLYCLDKVAGVITPAGGVELSDCNISVILCDTGNGIWIGSQKGLYRKNAVERTFHNVSMSDVLGQPLRGITSIVKDGNYSLWIAAFGRGLLRYDIREDRAYPIDDHILRRAHVVSCDAAGNVWVGTWGGGLVRLINPYAPGKIRYVHYKNNPTQKQSLLDDIVYAIEEDRTQNTIWVGTRSGLSILHDIDKLDSFQNFKPGDNAEDLPYNEVNSILRARDNLMWIGMLGGGVCKIQTGSAKFETNRLEAIKARYNTSSIRSMYYQGDGCYWFGLLDFGLIHYNSRTGQVVDYRDHPDLKALPYTSTVNSIFRRPSTGELCFGTWNAGVWIYDQKRHTVRQINSQNTPQMRDDCISDICEDGEGNLWIGTRMGLYVEKKSGAVEPIDKLLGGVTTFAQARVCDICCDGAGNIWVASNGQGILKVTLENGSWQRFSRAEGMTTDNIYCVSQDDMGNIWAGTIADGLTVYVAGSLGFKSVTAFPNLENKGVYNIASDQSGRMWITTNNTVFSFSPDAKGDPEHINTYILSSEMQPFFFNRNASAQIDYGRMVFGGSNGLKIFAGNRTQSHPTRLPLVFTDFSIHNRSLRSMEHRERQRITQSDVDFTEQITLSHDQNNFNIEFSMLAYANPRDHIFKYKLEGFDKEYVSVDSHHRFAAYSNLPAGRYTFRLQAAGGNGVWSSNERRLAILIQPAPWLSWWAFSLYGLALVAVIWGAVRFLRYRLRMQHEVRISKFEKHKIEELNHAKLQFFTNVTHELMTPLTIIIASLESLRNGVENSQGVYSVMSTNATRLMRLIQQILEFRKVESGNLRLRVSQGEVSRFVRKCVEAFAPLVAKKRLKVYFHCSAERIEGWFDPDKLDKIVYNLLSNAAKYTPVEGEINIRIETHDTDFVSITVANNGERMSQQTIAGLFKRFYDGNYRKFHTIGTGIGLSLVKDLTDIHNGQISVSSTAEMGNCFSVRLPISRESYSEEQIDETVDQVSQEEITQGLTRGVSDALPFEMEQIASNESQPQRSILIVDDNEELRVLVSNLLSQYFHIKTAADGAQALELLAQTPIDLIVSDIMMPVMDGIELCQKVKSTFEYCHIPVILLSAKNADESRIEGYNSGADGYVTKPFNLPLLYAQIINQLRKQESRSSRFRNQIVLEVEKLEYTSMDEDFMRRAMECANGHIDDCDFSQADFTREMNTSRTVLTEKLKSLTGLTPSAFIIDVRLRAAHRLLEEQQRMRIADLAYASGFNDPKYFSTCFKKKYGLSPKELIDKLGERGDKIA